MDVKNGDKIPDGAVHADEVFGAPVPDEAISASELLDDHPVFQHQAARTKQSAAHTTQTTPKPPIQWLKFTAILLLVFALFFGRSIYDSEFYQRNFNTTEWNAKQQKRAERVAAHRELDRQECAIMLRAKAELIPIEIERYKLIGMSDANAARYANNDYADEERLCNLLH